MPIGKTLAPRGVHGGKRIDGLCGVARSWSTGRRDTCDAVRTRSDRNSAVSSSSVGSGEHAHAHSPTAVAHGHTHAFSPGPRPAEPRRVFLCTAWRRWRGHRNRPWTDRVVWWKKTTTDRRSPARHPHPESSSSAVSAWNTHLLHVWRTALVKNFPAF